MEHRTRDRRPDLLDNETHDPWAEDPSPKAENGLEDPMNRQELLESVAGTTQEQ